MKFSIAIPVYAQADYLPTALDSIREQSVDVELAVMDATPDNSVQKVLEEYRGLIRYHRHGPDIGQSAAIEEGWSNTQGDIIAWLNADDYYFPGALDKVASFFNTHPEVDVVYGDAIHVNRDGSFLSYFLPIQEFNARDIGRVCFICQPACFVRRSAYEKAGGIDKSLHFTMDWDLWCRLADSGAKFHYLHDVLAAVRYYTGTKTLSGSKERYLEIWRIERKYGKRLIPRSWPSFYLCDLSFKEKKTILENFTFNFLQFLRRIKNQLLQSKNLDTDTVINKYGFKKNGTEIIGKCILHFPWYDKGQLLQIHLYVFPGDGRFRISINDEGFSDFVAQDGIVVFSPQDLAKPCIKIAVECLEQNCWKLLKFDAIKSL